MSEKETVAQNTPTETAKTETAAEAKKKQDAADAKTAKEVKAKEDKELADAKAKQDAEDKKTKANAPFVEIAERYAPHYPDCSAFHITSDKQVFLEGDKAAADEHQAELGEGKVTTIKVK